MSKRTFTNDPYSKFTNKDKDYVSAKINFDKSISIDFFSIVLSGDISKLDQFITNKGDVINALNEDGINALHIVLNTDLSELNKLNVIKYLLGKKIYTENKNKMGETPLHIASKNNYKSIIIELVKNGADIQASDSLGKTPIHYLARGLVVECEKTYIEDIIDDPKPKHDKKVISQMAKDIKEFYNDELLNNWANSLESIQNSTTGVPTTYNNRLIDFFGHVKSASKRLIESDDILNENSLQIANDIKKIADDVTLSDEEKKLQTEKIRKDYYNKVYKVIQNFDFKFDQNIDLTPTFHIDNDGLILARAGDYNAGNLIDNTPKYSNNLFAQTNYGAKDDNTSFYKVNGEATLNQRILQRITENGKQLLALQNDIRKDMDNLHNEIGNGVIETCEDLASFIHTINFYQEIYRLNEFINSNPKQAGVNYYTVDNAPPNLPADGDLDSNKRSINITTNLIDNTTPVFNEKYFMIFDAGAFPPAGAADDLDIINQDKYDQVNQFNQNILTNKLNINNVTSQNITANGNEIVIDLSNFNWNLKPAGVPLPVGEQFITLGFANKTTGINYWISRDFKWGVAPNNSNIIVETWDRTLGGNQLDQVRHLTGNDPAGPNIKVQSRNLLNLVRLVIRKGQRQRNQTVLNTINLSLVYIADNGSEQTLNMGEGQFDIVFYTSNGGPVTTHQFNISDFSTNEINYQNFFDSHNIGPGNEQFIFTPIIALINQIKNTNIRNTMTTATNFVNTNLIVNDANINNFYNQLHKWYIRYYETLNMYSKEFIKGKPVANRITEMIDNLNFKNNLQNPLYNTMYQNLINNKVDLLEEIDSEISTVSRRLERIINGVNNFVDLVRTRFDYFNMYQYFNEQGKNFNLLYNIDVTNSLNELDSSHFSGNDNKILRQIGTYLRSAAPEINTAINAGVDNIIQLVLNNLGYNVPLPTINFATAAAGGLINPATIQAVIINILNNVGPAPLVPAINAIGTVPPTTIGSFITDSSRIIPFNLHRIIVIATLATYLTPLYTGGAPPPPTIAAITNETLIALSHNYFSKYNNILERKVQPPSDTQIQPIGINFINNAGVGQSFTDVVYDPRILNGYFYLARYRMIEELVLDIHFQSINVGPKKDIYDLVKKYVTDNLGQVNPLMERPLILSIIGDLIDNHLISNVKKALYDAVTELVNQQISPNIGTQPIPNNAIPFIVQATNPVTGPGDVEIKYSAVDFDVEFGLNLGKQDELVRKALDKITVLNMDKLLNLSFGDMLLSNKIKNKTEIGKSSSEVVQQVFYPTDFLSTINSNTKCTIYDPEIAGILDSVGYPVNLDQKDYYGNSPLYYAINSQNYLFAEKLIKKNARILNIQNNDKQNPFIYVLEKLSSICEYFGKDKNIIYEFNEYYSIGLKEEVMKLANHGNIMQNIDKIVLLYLFLLNSSFFNEMYKKDYDLLNLLKEIYDDNDTFDLFDGDSNYQSNFNYIFLNPILDRHNKSNSSTSIEIQNRDMKFDVVINLEKELKEKISKKQKEKDRLEAKVNNYTSIQSLLQPTNVSYATNIQDNIANIQIDIAALTTDIVQLESQLNKATTDIQMTANNKFANINLGYNNIFQQIFEISKSYNENKYKDFTFRPFLKALHTISEDKSSFNNTYFFHHLISKVICQFVDYAKNVMNQKLITSQDLNDIESKLDRIINIMKRSMYKYIHHKNNNVRNIDNNKQLNDQFMRMCFTIDIAVGNTFYKVLKRLLMTFLKNRYPVSNEDADKYLIFIRQKVDKILNKVDSYIQTNIDVDNYEPSELTKKMVLLNTGYKSSTNEYSSSDENYFFEFIISSIQNNGFETIDDKEPLIKYLKKEFLPYFISYYRICISKLVNVTNSYENFIINQYHNLNMFKLLLKNLIEGITPIPSTTGSDPIPARCDINTC